MIALVADSTAYPTREEAQRMELRLVPMTYSIAGRQYLETYGDKNGNFEALVARYPNCTTAQATVSSFAAAFEELVERGFDVLCLTISSRLSGTYSCASIAARNVNPLKIRVVDSLSTAGGMYLLLRRAWMWINEGMGLSEVAQRVEAARDRVGIAFSVENMDALRRSGRLGIVRQSVGTILNIRPILLCRDGALVAAGMARGKTEQLRMLAARVPDNAAQVVVQHLSSSALAEPLEKLLRQKLPQAEILRCAVGPVLCINIGLGAVGVSWICREDSGLK